VATTFRLLYDDRRIYLGVRCEEPCMNRVFDKVSERGGAVWKENAVEIVLRPPGETVRVYHLSVNTLGTVFEVVHAGKESTVWSSQARAAADLGDTFWSAEIAIPLASFGVEAICPGDVWRGNFSRHRTAVRPSEIAAWSPTYEGVNRPERFGWLTAE
jgi:hypothetical protein